MMGVLDYLSFPDLVTIAGINSGISRLILDHYVGDMKGASLHITLTDATYSSRGIFRPVLAPGYDYYKPVGYDLMLRIVKAFCFGFSDLDIVINQERIHDSDLIKQFADLVNTHCSTVPQRVTISRLPESANYTFQNVSTVVFDIKGHHFSNFPVDQYFPRVERLTVYMYGKFSLAQHLPHLKHVELKETPCGSLDWTAFGAMNPQIRSGKFTLCGHPERLREANEVFPNLETLRYYPIRGPANSDKPSGHRKNAVESVRFRNVKHYSLDLGAYGSGWSSDLTAERLEEDNISAITFDQLESFEYSSKTYKNQNDQIDFVLKYPEVQRLNITSFVMTYDKMKRLVDSLPKLREIKLTSGPVSDIFRLMSETRLDTVHVELASKVTRAGFFARKIAGTLAHECG